MDKNKLVTLKLIGFNEGARNSFSAVLTLASRALNKKWLITEAQEADFFLLSAQSSATANRERLLKGLFAERCLFCTTENSAQENELPVDRNHAPRLSVLAALFNKMTASKNSFSQPEVSELNSQVSSTANAAAENTQTFFDPQQGLLGHLLAAQYERIIVCLTNQPLYAPLYIDTEQNVYYSKNPLEQLDSYLAPFEKLSIEPASKVQIENLAIMGALKSAPLKELIWYIVMKTSSGKPMKGFSTTTDIVALKSWPDLRLFKCLNYAKVATFMKNNAAPLEIIAAHTEMPLEELNNFYNACYLMGLIESKNQIEINKKKISAERLDLLNQIDARLK